MKCAKVIVFYFGYRRQHSNNVQIKSILHHILQNEKVDFGYPTDTFFVVNKSGSPLDDSLDTFDGMDTTNGKIRVIKRENIGLSFGGYIDIFNQYRNEYKYWMFLEDDVMVYKENYIKDFIDELETSDSTFIALSPISDHHSKHCGGGCGLTSTEYMGQIYTPQFVEQRLSEWSKHNGYDAAANALGKDNAEIQFTKEFVLQNHTKFSPLCVNWIQHSSQIRFKYLLKENQEFIYKVGK